MIKEEPLILFIALLLKRWDIRCSIKLLMLNVWFLSIEREYA